MESCVALLGAISQPESREAERPPRPPMHRVRLRPSVTPPPPITQLPVISRGYGIRQRRQNAKIPPASR